METAPTAEIKTILIICWYSTLRASEVGQLTTQNVTCNRMTGALIILVTTGKGVAFTNPYTVTTVMPTPWATIVADWIDLRLRTGTTRTPLFTSSTRERNPALLMAMRSVQPQANQRSLRRGAVTRLAATGATEEELRDFTNHRSNEMLNRYLGWKAQNTGVSTASTRVAKAALNAPPAKTPK
ncbi:MAG TPA: site-specific integrase [Planctomycetes bacterium]|nr:site-specific integrase [Planctomycetota bacterium]